MASAVIGRSRRWVHMRLVLALLLLLAVPASASARTDASRQRVNAAPTCEDVFVNANNHTPAPVHLDCTDADGDALTYAVKDVLNGSVSGTAPDLTFTPDGDYAGQAKLTYTASDGLGGTSAERQAYVQFAFNALPQCTRTDITMKPNTTAAISFTCVDTDGDSVVVSVFSPPTHGTVDLAAMTYTPASGY